MNVCTDLLKEKAIRVTPQRLAVYKVLTKDRTHPTAEDIYKKVNKEFPSISLATIYSILELFKRKGLIAEIRINFDKSCFEARRDLHHHFFCKKCGKIFDINIQPCATLKKKSIDGHQVEDFQGYFYGLCRDCQK